MWLLGRGGGRFGAPDLAIEHGDGRAPLARRRGDTRRGRLDFKQRQWLLFSFGDHLGRGLGHERDRERMIRDEVEHRRGVRFCAGDVRSVPPRDLESDPSEVERVLLGERRGEGLFEKREQIDRRVLNLRMRPQQLPRGDVRRDAGKERVVRVLQAHAHETEPETGLEVPRDQLDTRRACTLGVLGARGRELESLAVVGEQLVDLAALDQPRLDK